MTRRSYLEAKLAKREVWAASASAQAESRFARADQISERFTGGQPILVGHHSERGARADQERIHNAMDKGIELADKAAHHSQAASGIAHQLDHSIFSDDNNAIGALEARIAEREAKASRMVALNSQWRKSKGDVATFAQLAGITEAAAQGIANEIAKAYSWEKQPHAAYELSNLRGLIRADKKRIDEITIRQQRTAEAEAAGGVTVKRFQTSCFVTFAEKPDRATIDALKAAGFYWQAGGWAGEYAKLPEGIE